MERLDATGYLAAPGFERPLFGELERIIEAHGRLIIAAGPPQDVFWAQNVWLEPVRIPIASIADGARKLRAIQRNWALFPCVCIRRARLIEERLPHVSAKPIDFPAGAPAAPLGSWTLVREDEILASARCTSPFPNGEPRFVEHKVGPPSRAYLKLWEALTLLGRRPQPGERCLDAGASPGGWTWALARLGASVLAVDRAPLDPAVAPMPGVTYVRGSAFSIRPPHDGPFDWILSDVVCYPERLWPWVEAWLDSGACRNIVCTIKFQGSSHYGPIERFASVRGSRLIHLWHNRHELTWFHPADPGRLR